MSYITWRAFTWFCEIGKTANVWNLAYLCWFLMSATFIKVDILTKTVFHEMLASIKLINIFRIIICGKAIFCTVCLLEIIQMWNFWSWCHNRGPLTSTYTFSYRSDSTSSVQQRSLFACRSWGQSLNIGMTICGSLQHKNHIYIWYNIIIYNYNYFYII